MRLEHGGPVGALALDGHVLASGCWNGQVSLWDTREGQLVVRRAVPVGGIRGLALAPDQVLVAGLEGFTRVDRNLRKSRPLKAAPPAAEISLGPAGQAVLSANPPVLLDLATGKCRRIPAQDRVLREALAFAQRCCFAARGKYLLVSAPEVVEVLAAEEPYGLITRLEWTAFDEAAWVGPLSASPDGQVVAAVCDHQLRIWNVTGKAVELPERDATCLAFSEDGRFLAVATENEVAVLSCLDWSEKGRLDGPRDRVTALLFDSQRQLFGASEDGGVYRWDLT